MSYRGAPGCTCARCRMSGMMGPAVLVTLGVLFMIHNFTGREFQWPILLIVIGVVKILQYSASTEGHRPAGYVPPAGPITTPPPAATAGNLPAPQGNQYNSSAQGYEENRNG
jgi:hypothetical protein